jgi:hypothetical protein
MQPRIPSTPPLFHSTDSCASRLQSHGCVETPDSIDRHISASPRFQYWLNLRSESSGSSEPDPQPLTSLGGEGRVPLTSLTKTPGLEYTREQWGCRVIPMQQRDPGGRERDGQLCGPASTRGGHLRTCLPQHLSPADLFATPSFIPTMMGVHFLLYCR